MKKICTILLAFAGFIHAHAQTMSNTDNVITLNNTCINFAVSNGPYTRPGPPTKLF